MARKYFVSTILALFVAELLSWLSYAYPVSRTGITIGVLVIIFALACYRLQWGVAAILAELVVSSQGYLLAITQPVTISLRLGLFAVVLLATGIWIIRERRIALLQSHYWKWYVAVISALGIALLTAIVYGNDYTTIFLDANGYLFIAMVLPFTQALRTRADLRNQLAVLMGGVVVLMLQTVVVLFAYSHVGAFGYYLPDLYRWLRDFRLAEISPQDNGFMRVFFQSHLYVVMTFILASVTYIKQQQRWWTLPLLSCSLTLIFISYSRSFWVATIVIIVLLAVFAQRRAGHYLVKVIGGAVVGFLLTLAIINVPLFSTGSGVDASALLTDRTSNLTDDVGGGSRLALFKPLALAAVQHPFLGSGFGTTVTYATKDLRALEGSDDGLYTTYAFEWGYLDLWLKLGIFGTMVYGLLVIGLLIRLWSLSRSVHEVNDQIILLTAAGGLIALMGIHALTPYLNHPLGLGWLVFATAIAMVYDSYVRTVTR